MPRITTPTKPAPVSRQDDRLLFAMYDVETASRHSEDAAERMAGKLDDHDKTMGNLTDEMEELKDKIKELTEVVGKLVTVLESIDNRQAEALAK